MTDLDIYQPANGQLGQYQAGIIMTPESAKALDDQVRLCTEAVLREGTDYGVIPGTNGEKTLWRPGAQKLLQWFGLGYTCERIEVERDDDGRKHGITYKCTVARRLPDGSLDIKATCEGTADYDESKFYQTAEQVKAKLRDAEHKWAAKDRRAPNADRWNSAKEYRADWNALMKRAQKRAIVGAVNDATAAGGIFTDREEDDHAPATQDDGPSWYEQALERAAGVTSPEDGNALYVEAAEAHKKGWCNRRQQDTIQNILKKRARLLKKATPVDVEDLGRQAAAQDEDPGPASDEGAKEEAAPLEPGEAAEYGTERHAKLIGVVRKSLVRFGYPITKDETDEQRAARLDVTAKLAGVAEIGSSSDLDTGELSKVADTLTRCKNREALDKLLNAGEVGD